MKRIIVSNLVDSEQRPNDVMWGAFKRRVFLIAGVLAFLWLFVNFVSATVDILLLLFLCILIAAGLRGAGDWFARYTPLSKRVSLGIVTLLFIALIAGAGFIIGPSLASQLSQLNSTLEVSLQQVESELMRYGWGQELIDRLPTTSDLISQIMQRSSSIFERVTGILSSVVGLLSSIVVVIFVSLFFAIEPDTYVNNFVRLIPQDKRQRVRDTLSTVNDTLKKWLLTRAASMIEVGILSFIGLQLLDMPLTLSLALIAAIGAFIPTFGPILALIPAVLVALIQSPETAVLVVVLYLAIQMIDNYLVTPLLEKSMLYLPPAYIIAAQLIIGALTGAFGLVLAAPFAAVLVVLVRNLYVEDVLHDAVERGSATHQSD